MLKLKPFNYLSPIDPHVHLRGAEYLSRETFTGESFMSMALEDAITVGLSGVIEMPNPTPALTTEHAVRCRQKQAFDCGFNHEPFNLHGSVRHYMHVGITEDEQQVTNALRMARSNLWDVHGDKTFYVHSTGNMGILDATKQRNIWRLKAETDYSGVSIGHFEDENYFQGLYDPKDPVSHSVRQDAFSEVIQVVRQLNYAREAGFKGTFYIAHVSNPATVYAVDHARMVKSRPLPFEVVMEATWHHLFLNTDDYLEHGNCVKMNPPLRPRKMQEELLDLFLDGRLDIIGTDHAPHPFFHKKRMDPFPSSGIPALLWWPRGIQRLHALGMDPHRIDEVTFWKANSLFKLHLQPRTVSFRYRPDLWERYGWNPFSRLDREDGIIS